MHLLQPSLCDGAYRLVRKIHSWYFSVQLSRKIHGMSLSVLSPFFSLEIRKPGGQAELFSVRVYYCEDHCPHPFKIMTDASTRMSREREKIYFYAHESKRASWQDFTSLLRTCRIIISTAYFDEQGSENNGTSRKRLSEIFVSRLGLDEALKTLSNTH